MSFQIGSQHAHLINNVAGDQWNQVTLRDDEARAQIGQLRDALERSDLAPAVVRQARAHLDEAEAAMSEPSPAKPAVADRLRQLTHVLVAAGGLATAGGALLGPLGALAGWLGGLGMPILDLLHREA